MHRYYNLAFDVSGSNGGDAEENNRKPGVDKGYQQKLGHLVETGREANKPTSVTMQHI